jgi:hypothetical protein
MASVGLTIRRLATLGLLMVAMLATGCQVTPANPRPSTALDPCADRLYEAVDPLLEFYALKGRLPDQLSEVRPANAAPLVCPVSGKAYVYNPRGLTVEGRKGFLILYDPLPSHTGMRWGVMVEPGGPDEPLAARVILLPNKAVTDAEIAAHRPAPPAKPAPSTAPPAAPAPAPMPPTRP